MRAISGGQMRSLASFSVPSVPVRDYASAALGDTRARLSRAEQVRECLCMCFTVPSCCAVLCCAGAKHHGRRSSLWSTLCVWDFLVRAPWSSHQNLVRLLASRAGAEH